MLAFAVSCFATTAVAEPVDVEATFSSNNVEPHEPYEIDQEAMALHESLRIADLHADTLLWLRDPLEHSMQGQLDVPRLRLGNVALQVFDAVTKSPGTKLEDNPEPDDLDDTIHWTAILDEWPPETVDSVFERAIYQAEKLWDAQERAPDEVRVVETASDLEEVLAERARGKPLLAAILGAEGLHPLEGELENVQHLFDVGYRVMGLQHFFDNELGGSLHGLSDGGLTDFGREVIREIDRLNAIIDVAHSSEAVVRDVLDMTSRPIVLTHTGMRGACDSARNISDELMVRIAEGGGLIGIGYWQEAVCGTSPEKVVDNIRYAIDLLGLEHVALGSDFDGGVDMGFDTSELAALTQEMLDRGFTEEEIEAVMGGNTIAFMQKNLPGGSESGGDGGGCSAGGTAPPESGLGLIVLIVLGIGARRRASS
jgi:uncharacterized protein (TIGR03382 family)